MTAPTFNEPKFEIEPKYLSFISHHVRGQYNGLLGFSELLSQNFFRLSEDEKLEYINQINASAKKSFINVENMILWLKIISSNLSSNPSPVKLLDIFEYCIAMCNEEAEIADVDVKIECSDTITLNTDKMMLTSIINNLLMNALKSGVSGGEVTISAKTSGNKTEITIEDNGKAISKQDVVDFFTLPVNKRPETYDVRNGLGLWVVNELLKLMQKNLILAVGSTGEKTFTISGL